MKSPGPPQSDPFSILPGRYFVYTAFESLDLKRFDEEAWRYLDAVGNGSRHAVIVGDIGKGKTHFLKHYIHELRESGEVAGFVDFTKLLKDVDVTRFAEDAMVQVLLRLLTDEEWGLLASFQGEERKRFRAFVHSRLEARSDDKAALRKGAEAMRAAGDEASAQRLEEKWRRESGYRWEDVKSVLADFCREVRTQSPDRRILLMVDEVEMITKGNLSVEVELQLFNLLKDFLEELLTTDDPALGRGVGVILAVTGIAWHHIETKQPHFKQRFHAHLVIPDYGWEDLRYTVFHRLRTVHEDASKCYAFDDSALRLINKAAKGNMRKGLKWCSDLYEGVLRAEYAQVQASHVVKRIPTLYNRASVDQMKRDLNLVSARAVQLFDDVLYSPDTVIPKARLRDYHQIEIDALLQRQILREEYSSEGTVYRVVLERFLDTEVPVDKYALALLVELQRAKRSEFPSPDLQALARSITEFPESNLEAVLQQLEDRKSITRVQKDGQLAYRLVSAVAPNAWERVYQVEDQPFPMDLPARQQAEVEAMRKSAATLLTENGIVGAEIEHNASLRMDIATVNHKALGKIRVGIWYICKVARGGLMPLTQQEVRETVERVKAHNLEFLVVMAHAQPYGGGTLPDMNLLRTDAPLERFGLADLASPVREVPGNHRVFFICFDEKTELNDDGFREYFAAKGRYPRASTALLRFSVLRTLPEDMQGPLRTKMESISETYARAVVRLFGFREAFELLAEEVVAARMPVPLVHVHQVPKVMAAVRAAPPEGESFKAINERLRGVQNVHQALAQLRKAGLVAYRDEVYRPLVADVAESPCGRVVLTKLLQMQGEGLCTPAQIVDAILADRQMTLPKPQREAYAQSVANVLRIIRNERGELVKDDGAGGFRAEPKTWQERLESLLAVHAAVAAAALSPAAARRAWSDRQRAALALGPEALRSEVAKLAARSEGTAHQRITELQQALVEIETVVQQQVREAQEAKAAAIKKLVPIRTELQREAAILFDPARVHKFLEEGAKRAAGEPWGPVLAQAAGTYAQQHLADVMGLAEAARAAASPILALPSDLSAMATEEIAARSAEAEAARRKVVEANRAREQAAQDLRAANAEAAQRLQRRYEQVAGCLRARGAQPGLVHWSAYTIAQGRLASLEGEAQARGAEGFSAVFAARIQRRLAEQHFAPLVAAEQAEAVAAWMRPRYEGLRTEFAQVFPSPTAPQQALIESIGFEKRVIPELRKAVEDGAGLRLDALLREFEDWEKRVQRAIGEARGAILTADERVLLQGIPDGDVPLADILKLARDKPDRIDALVRLAERGFLTARVQVKRER